jgi:MinD superfamily P-loop ATPase
VQTLHGATRPLGGLATEYPTCATIPGPLQQVSYSCHDHRRCTSCRTCHLHTRRQANVILQRNKGKRKTKQNYPGFEFKSRQVNDSSQSNQGIDHLVSHTALDTYHGIALMDN